MRFTVHQFLKVTPFEKHYGRKPVRKLDNLLNLEFPEKDLLESVRDSSGRVVAENFYSKEEIEELVHGRTYGRSREDKDLREMLKQKKTVGKFVVLKSRKANNLESKFDNTPKRVIEETQHTVTVEGGKVYHKKDVADCSKVMLGDSFQKPNKPRRGVFRSTESGQFKKAKNNTDIPHTVGTGRDAEAKERRKKGLKNPHSQSWAEAKAIAEKNRQQNSGSQGSSDPTVKESLAQDPNQSENAGHGQDQSTAQVTAEDITTGNGSTMAVDATTTSAAEADPQVLENGSGDAAKQVFCDGPEENTSTASVTGNPPPIFSAHAPIKQSPGNYTDTEDFTVVRKSTRLPTARRVNKYGGVSYS